MGLSAAYRIRAISCVCIVFGVLGRLDRGAATCTLPSGLVGSWLRASDKAVLTIKATNVTNHKLEDNSGSSFLFFTCQQNTSNDIFILGDTNHAHSNPINSQERFNTYFCWQLVKVSDITYLLYELTSLLPQNDLSFPLQRVYKQNSSNPVLDASAICSLSSSTQNPTILFKVVSGASDIDPAAIATAKQACPSDILATYNYVVDGAGCRDNETELDFCVDTTTARANYTLCPTDIMFSKNGFVSCLYSFQLSNSLTILLANQDDGSDVDNMKYFRFSCMVVNSTGSAKTARIYAGPCDRTDKNQTLELTRTGSCGPADESSLNIIPIVVGVVVGVVVVALIVVIVVLVVKMRERRFRAVTPNVPPKAEHAQNGEAHGAANVQQGAQMDQQQTTADHSQPLPDPLPPTEIPRGGPERGLRLPPLEGAPIAVSTPLRS